MVDEFIKESLSRYVEHRISPGGFLTAVLENNLMEAVGRADAINMRNLHEISKYVYNELPSNVWGSREKVEKHLSGEQLKDN